MACPKAIESILKNNLAEKYEILVVAPDDETLNAAKIYSKRNRNIRLIRDLGKGKPAALNMVLKKAKGNILVLTDGDVYLGKNSINYLLDYFKTKTVGAVCGRAISLNKRNSMLGYWSHLLTDAAHTERLKRYREKKFLVCTGYLYAVRKVFNKVPEKSLADDAWISHKIWEYGYDIVYEPKAKVYVKYPPSFKDWIKQKRSSAGGAHQIEKDFKHNPKMRNLWTEMIYGPAKALSYARSPKELLWSLLLFPSRLYLWGLTYYDYWTKKKFEDVWLRVDSTK